ncbi:MAG: anaerobic nitric oxide reductase flavorubredoxin [Candidatus Cloacimonetes bacterium]|nr:anaerobic nitric oxide reductase flavorubredoxin [Candidatus Cloacimonadota bacterium]MCF7812999.1 anaerobic nitric oxide reductase flavorubredoxin [Candidatus Cloacimonadota bacterium]MCF7867269.1 anaerobic nitric oxide reductase flavorubredoxin [Candidatus Cloacimonadota bacterium]MCF7882713.1 anaerobic nitric oxide reductase flavorubredoxin [Candidatus Cloacimonadota bacterium]
MSFNVKNNIYWVGKIDWELRKFHGEEYSTHKGSTYNSYLIREEKNVLIDTVWQPFAKEFVENLKKEIDLKKIDFIIANHAEIDHSGALPELMKEIPDTPIYCTKNALDSIKGHYHQDWNFKVVKTGDALEIGNGKKLIFVEAPMLHWPDSMFEYLTEDNVLFSNDAFGQHYASEFMFNDLVDQDELWRECIKYYANILTPFSKFVIKKIQQFLELKLPLDMICTSHGVIWRDNPAQIVEKYLAWADAYQEDQVTIVYDTMWNGTRIMAETIAAGIKNADPAINIKLFNVAHSDKNDVITEIFRSKLVLLGSPTINKGILTSIAALLEEVKGLSFTGKKAAAFGTYGWSGESPKLLSEKLAEADFEIIAEPLKAKWNPDEQAKKECFEFGKNIISKI